MLAASLLLQHAAANCFWVACARQGGSWAAAGHNHNLVDRISYNMYPGVGIGYHARADAVVIVKSQESWLAPQCTCGLPGERWLQSHRVSATIPGERLYPALIKLSYKYGNQISRIVGTSGKRLTRSPTAVGSPFEGTIVRRGGRVS